jgi:hypothetical protein
LKDNSAQSVSALTIHKQIPDQRTAGNKPYNHFLIPANLPAKKVKMLQKDLHDTNTQTQFANYISLCSKSG